MILYTDISRNLSVALKNILLNNAVDFKSNVPNNTMYNELQRIWLLKAWSEKYCGQFLGRGKA